MLSLIYNGFRYALSYTYLTKPEKEDTDKVISCIEQREDAKRDADLVDAGEKENTEEKNIFNKEGCYQQRGIITYVDNNHVVIDERYTYEKNDDMTSNLEVGDKIIYMTYVRDPNVEPKVQKILSVINDTWDNANARSEKHIVHTPMIERNIVAKVTKREGRIAVVEPHNIRIDLSKVQSDFIPMIGDWLMIESFVEVNSNSTDLSGEVLEVDRIKSLRSKLDIGVISKYDRQNEVGIIDKRVIFHKRACEPGYIPHVGDKVVSESIESDQGQCSWRSITIVPLIQAREFSYYMICIHIYLHII